MTEQQFLEAVENVLVTVSDFVEDECSKSDYEQHHAVLAEVRRRLEQAAA